MLDLQAGVHLDKIEFAVLEQEFHRADAAVSQFLNRVDDPVADGLALGIVERGRRRFLDQFLMAALQGTVTFAQMDDMAVMIGQDLDFDVAGGLQVLFHVDVVVGKHRLGLGAGEIEGLGHGGVVPDHLHAAPAAPGGGLDQDRKTDVLGGYPCVLGVGKRPFGPGHDRDSDVLDGLFGGDFVAHQADVVRRRADEDEFVFLDHGREVGVFGQEPVTRVDGIDMGDGGGAQDR